MLSCPHAWLCVLWSWRFCYRDRFARVVLVGAPTGATWTVPRASAWCRLGGLMCSGFGIVAAEDMAGVFRMTANPWSKHCGTSGR
jgi:hypothetical protein